MATYTNLNNEIFARNAIQGLCKILLPITRFARNFSPDQSQRGYAVDMLERTVSAINPERYANVYGTFSRNVQFHNGLFIDGNTGAVIGQDPRGILVPGSNGSFSWQPPREEDLATLPWTVTDRETLLLIQEAKEARDRLVQHLNATRWRPYR